MIQSSTIRFLKELKKNNVKTWFDEHRDSYENAREDFSAFIQQVIDKLSKKDKEVAGINAKSCLFRINRDVRFSKDKSPYKSNMGASINRGGKKSFFAGYYFHLEPGNSFFGGGLWSPMPQELQKVRQELDYCFDEFRKIISSKKFRETYQDLDHSEEFKLSRPPRGYENDNPAAEYLKLKSLIAMRAATDAELQSADLVQKTVEGMAALSPVIHFINRTLL